MIVKVVLIVFISALSVEGSEFSTVSFVQNSFSEWIGCVMGNAPTNCLEEKTVRNIKEINLDLENDLGLRLESIDRGGKALVESSDKELQLLESENQNMVQKIKEKRAGPRGLLDEIGDLITYATFRILDPLGWTKESPPDNDIEEDDDQRDGEIEGFGDTFRNAPSILMNESSDAFVHGTLHRMWAVPINAISCTAQSFAWSERGHKKKELKKKNKQLKLILILMLIKNKIKMFVNKLQFLVQLKFLLVSTINMLANVIRLWIELKKKHKPNKVVYYESAHHQHHYDNDHIHDHDDGYYSRPGSYSHHVHGEDEDYGGHGGGGPWPWSRSYTEKNNHNVKYDVSPYRRQPGYSVAYYDQRRRR